MDKSSLLKLAMTKNTIFSKYAIATRFFGFSHPIYDVNTSLSVKEASSTNLSTLLNNTDQIHHPSDIITLISANKNNIDGRHVVKSFQCLHKYYKVTAIPISDIHKCNYFKQMCKILNSRMRILDVYETISVFQVLCHFEVPNSTMIMTSLLQMIRCSINNLDLQSIIFLAFLLQKKTPTNLSTAILEALPKVFSAQLQLQLDKDNIKELTSSLTFASSHNLDTAAIEYIIDGIYKNLTNISVKQAVDIFLSLSTIRQLPNNYLNLLQFVQDIILEKIDSLNEKQVTSMLFAINLKVSCGFDEFYDRTIVNKLLEKIVICDYGFEIGIVSLKRINQIKHIHIPLLDYLVEACCHHPNLLFEKHARFILLSGLALANYKPKMWNKLEDILKNGGRSLINYDKIYKLFMFTNNLASFGCFVPELLKFVFSIPNLQDRPDLLLNGHQVLQQLYQNVRIFNSSYSGPWPSEKMMHSFKTLTPYITPNHLPLLPTLKLLLGSDDYIKVDMRTHLGHHIDYLLFLENGCPVAVEHKDSSKTLEAVSYVEDLNVPPSCEKVALLLLPDEAFCRNIETLQSPVMMNIKSLEAMSYKVAFMSIHSWVNLSDFERLPYLKMKLGISTEKVKKS